MTEQYITKGSHGIFVLNFDVCDSSVLQYLLDPSLPYIRLRHHMPSRYIEWKNAQAPLSNLNVARSLTIRGLVYDLMLSTQEFLAYLSEFAPYGMELYQLVKPVPDSLTLYRVLHKYQLPILLNNGVKTAFFLPHANECAQFWAVEKETVERALSHLTIQELAIANL